MNDKDIIIVLILFIGSPEIINIIVKNNIQIPYYCINNIFNKKISMNTTYFNSRNYFSLHYIFTKNNILTDKISIYNYSKLFLINIQKLEIPITYNIIGNFVNYFNDDELFVLFEKYKINIENIFPYLIYNYKWKIISKILKKENKKIFYDIKDYVKKFKKFIRTAFQSIEYKYDKFKKIYKYNIVKYNVKPDSILKKICLVYKDLSLVKILVEKCNIFFSLDDIYNYLLNENNIRNKKINQNNIFYILEFLITKNNDILKVFDNNKIIKLLSYGNNSLDKKVIDNLLNYINNSKNTNKYILELDKFNFDSFNKEHNFSIVKYLLDNDKIEISNYSFDDLINLLYYPCGEDIYNNYISKNIKINLHESLYIYIIYNHIEFNKVDNIFKIMNIKQDHYTNTIIIFSYSFNDYYTPYDMLISNFLIKHPYLTEKTYNYLKCVHIYYKNKLDLINNNQLNVSSWEKRHIVTCNYLYEHTFSFLKDNNIIRKNNILYNQKINRPPNMNTIKNDKDYLFSLFLKTEENNILDEI